MCTIGTHYDFLYIYIYFIDQSIISFIYCLLVYDLLCVLFLNWEGLEDNFPSTIICGMLTRISLFFLLNCIIYILGKNIDKRYDCEVCMFFLFLFLERHINGNSLLVPGINTLLLHLNCTSDTLNFCKQNTQNNTSLIVCLSNTASVIFIALLTTAIFISNVVSH